MSARKPGRKTKEEHKQADREMVAFLQKIAPHKTLLFGKHTGADGAITQEKKDEKWEEIRKEMVKEGRLLKILF